MTLIWGWQFVMNTYNVLDNIWFLSGVHLMLSAAWKWWRLMIQLGKSCPISSGYIIHLTTPYYLIITEKYWISILIKGKIKWNGLYPAWPNPMNMNTSLCKRKNFNTVNSHFTACIKWSKNTHWPFYIRQSALKI